MGQVLGVFLGNKQHMLLNWEGMDGQDEGMAGKMEVVTATDVIQGQAAGDQQPGGLHAAWTLLLVY